MTAKSFTERLKEEKLPSKNDVSNLVKDTYFDEGKRILDELFEKGKLLLIEGYNFC